MKLYPIHAGYFMADGGALFGVVPKVLWSKHYPSDENNLCKGAMRCLLVVDGDRKILIDSGAGDKYDEKYKKNNGLHGDETLVESLKAAGFHPDEITDMFFTHLHWDHCGGAVQLGEDGKTPELVFKNATHWVAESQWEKAWNPNIRDGNAYFSIDLETLHDSGKMKFIKEEGDLFPGFHYLVVDGHTPGQLIPVIDYKGRKVVFTADLVPVSANIPVGWLAGYDLFPVTTMEEKEKFMKIALDEDWVLFFEHDAYSECAELEAGKKGAVLKRTFQLNEL